MRRSDEQGRSVSFMSLFVDVSLRAVIVQDLYCYHATWLSVI